MKTRKDYIAKGTKRRSGLKLIGVKFLVAHDTGNKNSTAKNNVDYYKRTANEMSASAHLFVDDVECVECVPLNEKAWHVIYDKPKDNQMFGYDSNDAAIGVELCYFDDKARSLKAYQNYVAVLANLCKEYKLSPTKHIVGHETLDPGRKTDPTNSLKRIGKTFKDLIQDIETALKPKPKVTNKERCTLTVRFANSSSRLAGFKKLLGELGVKFEVEQGASTEVVKVAFAANSSKYGEVVEWLEAQKVTFEVK